MFSFDLSGVFFCCCCELRSKPLFFCVSECVKHPKTKDVLVKAGKKFTKFSCKRLINAEITEIETTMESILGEYAAHDIIDENTGEVIVGCNEPLTPDALSAIIEAKIFKIELVKKMNRPVQICSNLNF